MHASRRVPVVGVLALTLGGGSTLLAAAAPPAKGKPDFQYFAQRVMPIVRKSCAAGKCHGKADGPAPRFTAMAVKADEQQLRVDYKTAVSLIEWRKPTESPLLLKPLARRDGGTRHGGKDIFRKRSAEHRVLIGWIMGLTVGNVAPVADAGKDQNVDVGAKVQLDGTGSNDMNGEKLSYRWRIWERPAGSKAELADARSAQPSFTADVEGQYVIELWVTDGDLKSKPDRVTITAGSADQSTILLAPEQGQLTGPLQKRSLREAQGGAYVTAEKAVRNRGQVVLPFTLKRAGRYALWARVQSPETLEAFKVLVDFGVPQVWRVQKADDWTLQKARQGAGPLVAPGASAAKAAKANREAWRTLHGQWRVANGAYEASADPTGQSSTSTAVCGQAVSSGMIRVDATAEGPGASAYIVFDYRGPGKSRYAGVDISEGVARIGPDRPEAERRLAQPPGRTVRLGLKIRRVAPSVSLAQLFVDGRLSVERVYRQSLIGQVGLMTGGGQTRFDNFVILKGKDTTLLDDFSPPGKTGSAGPSGEPAGRAGQVIQWRLTAGDHRLTVSVIRGGVKLDQIQLRRLDGAGSEQ